MDRKTRQFLLDMLKTVHEAACRSVQAELEKLPSEERQAVEESIEAFKSCVNHLFEGTMQPEAAAERIAALIHGHAFPQSAQAMQQYARTLNELLCASRDRLTSTGEHRDN